MTFSNLPKQNLTLPYFKTIIFIPGLANLKTLVTSQRFKLLAKALFFSVVLMAADIISDIFTAWSLFSRSENCSKNQGGGFDRCKNFRSSVYMFTSNYFKWGVYTLIAIVMPLLARIVLNLVLLIRSLEMKGCRITITPARWMLWIEDLKQLPLHFPLLQPIRYNLL